MPILFIKPDYIQYLKDTAEFSDNNTKATINGFLGRHNITPSGFQITYDKTLTNDPLVVADTKDIEILADIPLTGASSTALTDFKTQLAAAKTPISATVTASASISSPGTGSPATPPVAPVVNPTLTQENYTADLLNAIRADKAKVSENLAYLIDTKYKDALKSDPTHEKFDANKTAEDGQSPMTTLALQGNWLAMVQLRGVGASYSAPDKNGYTPLINAIENGEGAAPNSPSKNVVTQLLKEPDVKAAINTPDANRKFTPLMWAYYRGNDDIAELLKKNGATPSDADMQVATAAKAKADQVLKDRADASVTPAPQETKEAEQTENLLAKLTSAKELGSRITGTPDAGKTDGATPTPSTTPSNGTAATTKKDKPAAQAKAEPIEYIGRGSRGTLTEEMKKAADLIVSRQTGAHLSRGTTLTASDEDLMVQSGFQLEQRPDGWERFNVASVKKFVADHKSDQRSDVRVASVNVDHDEAQAKKRPLAGRALDTVGHFFNFSLGKHDPSESYRATNVGSDQNGRRARGADD